MKTFITSLDFMGRNPTFLIDGERLYKTFFGGILSLTSIFFISAATGYFGYLLLSRSSYVVMISDEYNQSPYKNWTNEEFSIGVIDKLGAPLIDSRIFGITANFWWNRPTLMKNGTIKYNLIQNNIEIERCNISKHFSENENLWSNIKNINESYCINKNQILNSSFPFGSLNYTGIVFWIHKCINTTKQNQCASSEEIDNILSNIFVTVRFKDYYFLHDNYKNYEIPYIYMDSIGSSSTVYKRTWYQFKNIEYESDTGFIFPETNTKFLTIYGNQKDSTDLRKDATIPGSFAVISLNMHSMKGKFLKKYYKAQNMIADLGGITKGIITIISILSYFIREKTYLIKLINENSISLIGLNKFKNTLIEKEMFTSSKNKQKQITILNDNKIINPLGRKSEDISNVNKTFLAEIINNNDLTSKDLIKHKKKTVCEGEHKVISSATNFKNQNNFINFSVSEYQPNGIQEISASKRLNNLFSKRNPLSFSFKDYKKSLIEMTKCEIINPFFSLKKKPVYAFLLNTLEKQLDISNILSKINLVDKLTYFVTGDKYKNLLENSSNPFLERNKKFELNKISNEDLINMSPYFARNLVQMTKI